MEPDNETRYGIDNIDEQLPQQKTSDGEDNTTIDPTKVSKSRKAVSVPSWNEFTENTTLHGMRYIFDNTSSSIFRKALWVIFVLGSLGYFFSQVGLRILTFYEYKSVVDVQILHSDEVHFPAVTICNQNMFRMTKVVDYGLYQYFDEAFGKTFSSVNESVVPKLTSKNFMEIAGHQRKDFIDSCTWRGEPCDLDKDFSVTMTDIGICYTFNKRNPGRYVTESGSGQGLSLILNIEQYEYMRGPQTDAGAKVLLHDQSEYPRVRQLGFGVAPGIHTLVGVKRKQVTSLPSPYGHCRLTEGKYRSECQLECISHHIIDQCQCEDFFMPNVSNNYVKPCNVSLALTCVQHVLGMKQKAGKSCHCPVSCNRVVYEPTLSYVQLSRFNIAKMILTDPIKKSHLAQRYLSAKEKSQRVILRIVEEDVKIITNIKATASAIDKLLNSSEASMDNLTIFAKQNNLVPIGNEEENLVKDEKKNVLDTLMVVYNGKLYLLSATSKVDILHETVSSFLPVFLEIQGNNQSLLQERLQFCGTNLTTLSDHALLDITSETEGDYEEFEKMYNDYKFDFDEPECDTYLRYKHYHALAILKDSQSARKELRTIKSQSGAVTWYKLYLGLIFDSTWLSPDNIVQNQECLRAFGGYDPTKIEWQLDFVLASLESFVQARDIQGMLNVTADIMDSVKESRTIHLDYGLSDLNDLCSWVKEDTVNTKTFTKHMEMAEKTYRFIGNFLSDFQTELMSLKGVFRTDIENIVDRLNLYLNNQTSKLNLSKLFISPSTEAAIASLDQYSENLKISSRLLSTAAHDTSRSLRNAFHAIFNFTIPMMTSEVVRRLVMVKHVSMQNLSDFTDIMEEIYKDDSKSKEVYLAQMFDSMLDPYAEKISKLEMQVTSLLSQLFKDLNKYEKHLAEYSTNSKINQDFFLDNFLQLDVFYRDLAYERIEQQEELGFNALLGDIGGFLGLLLGASFQTVFEIVDYIILRFISKIAS